MTAKPDLSPTGDPWLLTPGPLTTSPTVKQAMLHDLGSRDRRFIEVNASVRRQLVALVQGEDSHVCVPLQGSGTFVVEAMVQTFVPADGKLLVLINGAYGKRIAKMCEISGIPFATLEWAEDKPVDPAMLDSHLREAADITHVAVVHCETTSGILNPIADVAAVVQRHGRRLLIDAMSAFGALPLDSREVYFDAVAASSNKCLEGVPGLGFCIARRAALEECKGNAAVLSLDLFDQWTAMEGNGQWRFTPPTHAILAFAQALEEYAAEGSQPGRLARYSENCRILIEGMRQLGFRPLLPEAVQAPIIVTFHLPGDARFDFQAFYDRLSQRGFVIYPGKLTVAETFRMGCIGRLGKREIEAALACVAEVLGEFGMTSAAAA